MRASIYRIFEKVKVWQTGISPRDYFAIALIFLVALISFALGKLSVSTERVHPIIFENHHSETGSVSSSVEN